VKTKRSFAPRAHAFSREIRKAMYRAYAAFASSPFILPPCSRLCDWWGCPTLPRLSGGTAHYAVSVRCRRWLPA